MKRRDTLLIISNFCSVVGTWPFIGSITEHWRRYLAFCVGNASVSGHRLKFYVYLFALQFVTNSSFYLIDIPPVQHFEDAICERHDAKQNVPEDDCKIGEIQDKLTYVLGFKIALDALPTMSYLCHIGATYFRV